MGPINLSIIVFLCVVWVICTLIRKYSSDWGLRISAGWIAYMLLLFTLGLGIGMLLGNVEARLLLSKETPDQTRQ